MNQNTQRINLDDYTAVDWQGAGYYEAYTIQNEVRYIWKRVATEDNPGGEAVHVTDWKQLIGKDLVSQKRW